MFDLVLYSSPTYLFIPLYHPRNGAVIVTQILVERGERGCDVDFIELCWWRDRDGKSSETSDAASANLSKL